MLRPKTAAPWLRLALLALLLPIAAGCVNVALKPSLKDKAPPAGCSERIAGLPLPAPPSSDLPAELPVGIARDWQAEYRALYAIADDLTLDWSESYTGAARAYTSEVRLRTNTADCLEAHRNPPTFWQRMFGKRRPSA